MSNSTTAARYSPDFLELLVEAREAAETRRQNEVLPAHALAAIVRARYGVFVRLFDLMKVDLRGLAQDIDQALNQLQPAPEPRPVRLEEDHPLLAAARNEAQRLEASMVLSEHLLLALITLNDPVTAPLLSRYQIDLRSTLKGVLAVRKPSVADAEGRESVGTLKRYGRDLTEQASAGDLPPVIEHSDGVRDLIRTLLQAEKNNPLLIGERGTGKSALCVALARRIAAREAPADLLATRLIELDFIRLLSDPAEPGGLEGRFRRVLHEADAAGQVVLVLTDPRAAITPSGDAPAFFGLLRRFLDCGKVRAVLLATPEEHKKFLEANVALDQFFSRIDVNEPTVETTISILRGRKGRYERHHGVRVTDEAVQAAARLSARFLSGQFLPGKALDLLDRACSLARMELTSLPADLDREARDLARLRLDANAEVLPDLPARESAFVKARADWEATRGLFTRRRELGRRLESLEQEQDRAVRAGLLHQSARLEQGEIASVRGELEQVRERLAHARSHLGDEIGPAAIASEVARSSGLPVEALLAADEAGRFLRAEEVLGARVIGQQAAVRATAKALIRMVAGMKEPHRPIAAFLFLGPTGVGKTELARALAQFMFGDEKFLTRIDMSEFVDEKIGLGKLIGSGPGYVGYEEGGMLTEAVRNRPYSLVLLDEVEKAAPAVFNTFLQVLEDGRLTDGKGRTISFANTLLVMTSNLGADLIYRLRPENRTEVLDALHAEVARFFRPEFRNRLTETVVFERLGPVELRGVLMLQTKKLGALLWDRRIRFDGLTDRAAEQILKEPLDLRMGARPLLRFIERELRGRLAEALLKKDVAAGDAVHFDVNQAGEIELCVTRVGG